MTHTLFSSGDRSARMLAKADAKRIYDRLRQVDLQTLEAGEAHMIL